MQEIGKSPEKFAKRLERPLYEFGPFRVDPQNRLLLRDGQPVPLNGKPFDILLALLEHHGQLLSKDELLARVWPDTAVEEGNLGRSVSSLRKALDDSPDEHRYIVTLSRHGYRFVGDVRERWAENGTAPGPAEIMPFPVPGPRPLPSTVPSTGGHRQLWFERWWIAAVAVLLAMVVAGYAWTRGRERHAVEPAIRQLTANPPENWVMGAAISPDGKYLAFADRTGLYVRSIGSGEIHPVSLPPEWKGRILTGLRWFPDGEKLIASVPGTDGADIWAIAMVGQSPPRLIRRTGLWPSISPDGLSIAFQNGEPQHRGKELWVAGIGGESPRKLLTAEDGELALSPVWSPDGRWIAYLKGPADLEAGEFARTAAIEIRPAAGGPAMILVPGASLPAAASLFCMKGRGCLVWSPDGRLVFSASDPSGTQLTRHEYSIWTVPVDLRKGAAAGKPVRLAHWADFYPNCLTLTADGKRLAFLKGRLQMDVYVGELGGDGSSLGPPGRLTPDNRGFGSTPDAWTRDSRAMLLSSDRNGKLEVFRQGLNESLAQRIVEVVPGDQRHDAQLSPDGLWILYVDRVSPQRLMRMPAAGGSPQLVLELPASARFDYKCPLATGACVISQDRRSEVLFYQLDPVRRKADRLLGSIERRSNMMFSWDVSPDGSRLAVVDTGNKILTLTDGKWREIPVDARWSTLQTIAWAADGKGFFATTATFYLLHVTTAGKVNVLIHNDRTQWLSGPAPSPDGRYLAFQAQAFDFNAWMLENP